MKDEKQCPLCFHRQPLECFELLDASYNRRHPYCDACRQENPSYERAVCRNCEEEKSVLDFPKYDPANVCNTCNARFGSRIAQHLNLAGLQKGGPAKTVGEILKMVGYPPVSKADLDAAGRWLRANGFERRKLRGIAGFKATLPSAQTSEFACFERDHPGAVAALKLPDAVADQYRDGAEVPHHLRLAMAAALMGLPPYEGGSPCS